MQNEHHNIIIEVSDNALFLEIPELDAVIQAFLSGKYLAKGYTLKAGIQASAMSRLLTVTQGSLPTGEA